MNLQFEGNLTRKIDDFFSAEPSAQIDVSTSCAPAEFSLDENCFIQECSKSVEKLFGYHQHELAWQHISSLFPKLSEVALMQDHRINQMFSYICRCGHTFDALSAHGSFIKCNLSLFLIANEGVSTLRLIVHPVSLTS